MEVTSLERKPAIPPADGASLNLLAERCSRVRGGVLGTSCKKKKRKKVINHATFLYPITNYIFLTIIVFSLPCSLVVSCCVETLDNSKAITGYFGRFVSH